LQITPPALSSQRKIEQRTLPVIQAAELGRRRSFYRDVSEFLLCGAFAPYIEREILEKPSRSTSPMLSKRTGISRMACAVWLDARIQFHITAHTSSCLCSISREYRSSRTPS
jgi:hypothetical protein